MATDAPAKLLVVANPADRDEIVAALEAAGLGEIRAGDGGDQTLALYRALAPEVVVLCAGLDRGDARALAAAIRAEPGGRGVGITLVGEVAGPVRNALDAADFEVDRFVGRPLSPKALAFSVHACAELAARAREEQAASGDAEPEPALVAAAEPAEPALAEPAEPVEPTLVAAAAPPEPGGRRARESRETVARVDRIDAAMDLAISEFVQDAMAALPASAVVRAAHDEPTLKTAVPSNAPALATADVAALPGDAGSDVAEGTWGDTPSWREPTVVIDSNAGRQDAADAPRRPFDNEDDGFEGAEPEELALEAAEDDDLSELAEVAAVYSVRAAGTGAGRGAAARDREPVAGGAVAADREPAAGDAAAGDGEAAGGGDFARELRRKMSLMAERLFPGQSAEAASSVDLGIAHGAHTEIDLNSLSVDTVVGHREDDFDDPIAEVGTSPTFADTETRASEARAGTGGAGTGAATGAPVSVAGTSPGRGVISPEGTDVATLFARTFARAFTGRVLFRRTPAEKAVYFDDGRPVFATSNLPHDRMGELLYREGKITREQHARCREVVVESGRRMGQILVEMGYLKRRELLPAVRRHIEDIIYSLFAWDSGEYIITAAQSAIDEKIRLSRHPAAITLEGVRRKYGPAMIEPRLGTLQTVVAAVSHERIDDVLAVADLSDEERQAVLALDGERTLEEVAGVAGVESLAAAQLAFALVALDAAHIIERRGESSVGARAPSLVGETDLAIDRQRVLAKHALVNEADYFMLLGVRRDASGFEIRRAYETARKDYAPDSFPAEVRDELGSEIDEINALIDEAYQVLREARVRASYLAHLRD